MREREGFVERERERENETKMGAERLLQKINIINETKDQCS